MNSLPLDADATLTVGVSGAPSSRAMPKARLTIADRLAARKPDNALARAQALQAAGHHLRAVKLFAVAATAGLTVAERELGRCYLRGEAVPRNRSEAARWFGRAADKGDTDARRYLAGLAMAGHPESGAEAALFRQDSAEPDFATALRWALLAAAEGDAESQVMAGFIYAAGPEELRDAARARFWYGKAAEAGAARGHLGYGAVLLHGAKTDADISAAIAHIRRAADEKVPTAYYYLGLIYEKAIGVPADATLAATYYGQAAQAGSIAAQTKYGAMLFRGLGLKANRAQGEAWLRRAGLAGDVEAAATLAQLYANGSDLPPNYGAAALWFRRAADAGDRESARALGVLYLTGAGVGRDADAAATWFQRANAAGDPAAQADLATLLLNRRTGAQPTGSIPLPEWYERAAEACDPIGAFNFAVWFRGASA
ncbi:MAG TPA: SEL1-like repeat protein [Acidocella sp.]|nr:SEL1-like repeat protein [Acidocella sp.]